MRQANILILLICSVFANQANAGSVKFEFTGVVTNLSSSLLTDFSIGETVYGTYIVDDSSFAASDLYVQVGNDYSLTADTGHVQVSPGVWFLVSFGASSGITGPAVNGNPPNYFDIQLNDDNNLLEAGVLPLSYPISLFGWDRSNINFPDDANRLSFEVQSISVASVPLPSSAVLLFSALVGLLGINFYKKQA